MEMDNHVNGKKTIIQLSPYRMNAGLDKKMFSSLVLEDIPLPDPITVTPVAAAQ
jgi:hypothetical protein